MASEGCFSVLTIGELRRGVELIRRGDGTSAERPEPNRWEVPYATQIAWRRFVAVMDDAGFESFETVDEAGFVESLKQTIHGVNREQAYYEVRVAGESAPDRA